MCKGYYHSYYQKSLVFSSTQVDMNGMYKGRLRPNWNDWSDTRRKVVDVIAGMIEPPRSKDPSGRRFVICRMEQIDPKLYERQVTPHCVAEITKFYRVLILSERDEIGGFRLDSFLVYFIDRITPIDSGVHCKVDPLKTPIAITPGRREIGTYWESIREYLRFGHLCVSHRDHHSEECPFRTHSSKNSRIARYLIRSDTVVPFIIISAPPPIHHGDEEIEMPIICKCNWCELTLTADKLSLLWADDVQFEVPTFRNDDSYEMWDREDSQHGLVITLTESMENKKVASEACIKAVLAGHPKA